VDELVARYEAPNAANRWDRPLFGLTPGDVLPYDAIKAALFEGKAPNPHLSTRAVCRLRLSCRLLHGLTPLIAFVTADLRRAQMPLSDTNYVYELDRTTQQVIQLVQEAQRLQGAVGAIDIPGASVPVQVQGPRRRAFIAP